MTAALAHPALAPRRRAEAGPLAGLLPERLLAGTGFVLVALMAPTAVAMLLDGRELLDIDIWTKPLKFQAALAIYAFTLAIYARWLPSRTLERRWYRVYAGLVAFSIGFEIAAIGGAAAYGVASHFNETTPLNAWIYGLMGVFAVILTSMSLVYGVLIARSDRAPRDPALKAGLVLGLVLTFVLTLVFAGTLSQNGSHFVGGSASDAGGLWLMGWARDGGDLRVAHFFGTHALHAVPLAGFLAGRCLAPRAAVAATWAAALAWTLLSVATFVQALAGRPFLPMLG
jgi:hypothetical protein